MPKFISIAVEHPENYLQKIPLRTIAVDADGTVWRGEATLAPLGPSTITWQPVASQFPAGAPIRLLGGPELDAVEDDLEP